jgi:putative salt-induced outer membrane protein YdiY
MSTLMYRVALAVAILCAAAMVRAQELNWANGSLMRLPAVEEASPEIIPTPPPGGAAATPASSEASNEFLMMEPGWQMWSPAFWDPWEGNVELGLSGTEGNSRTFNVRFGMTAKHKTETLVKTLQVTSIQKTANSVTTANTALVDARQEWPLPESRFNYYIHGLAEYDQFKAFDYRFSADSGIGYEFIQNDVTTLISRAGLSVSKEVGGNDGDLKPELALGTEYKRKFSKSHSVSAKVDYFPNLTDFGDYRVNSQAAWEIALAQAWGLSLKLSIIDRYDSTPQGASPNDLDYSTLVIWTF